MYLLGSHDVAQLGPLRLWAERGLVHIEDGRDNSFHTLTVKDALDRVQGLNDMLGNSTDDANIYYKDERERLMRFIETMIIVAKKAQEQGMPSDGSARRELKRRRSKTVQVPNIIDMEF